MIPLGRVQNKEQKMRLDGIAWRIRSSGTVG